MDATPNLQWHKIAAVGDLPDRPVETLVVGTPGLALVHYDGQYVAMDNRCLHQGGPLGEGVNSAAIFEALSDVAPSDAVIAVDEARLWASSYPE